MPRLARVDIGNEIYHVINRANEGCKYLIRLQTINYLSNSF